MKIFVSHPTNILPGEKCVFYYVAETQRIACAAYAAFVAVMSAIILHHFASYHDTQWKGSPFENTLRPFKCLVKILSFRKWRVTRDAWTAGNADAVYALLLSHSCERDSSTRFPNRLLKFFVRFIESPCRLDNEIKTKERAAARGKPIAAYECRFLLDIPRVRHLSRNINDSRVTKVWKVCIMLHNKNIQRDLVIVTSYNITIVNESAHRMAAELKKKAKRRWRGGRRKSSLG